MGRENPSLAPPSAESADHRRNDVRVSAGCPAAYRIMKPDEPAGSAASAGMGYPMPSLPAEAAERFYAGGDAVETQIMELLLWVDWKINT